MFRPIVVPYATAGMTDVEMVQVAANRGQPNRRGRYEYAFRTVSEARLAAEVVARNHPQGCSVFILDDEEGVIVERSRAPRRPAFVWESVQVTQAGKESKKTRARS